MNVGIIINNSASSATTCLGISVMTPTDYRPIYLFINLIVIILTSICVGFMAEEGFNNFKKYKNGRLGK